MTLPRPWLVGVGITVFLAILLARISFVDSILLLPLFAATTALTLLLFLIWSADQDQAALAQLATERRTHAFRALAIGLGLDPDPGGEKELSSGIVRISLHKSLPETINRKLDALFVLIRKSFILPWYRRISPTDALPDSVELLIRETVVRLVEKSEAVDWPTFAVSRLVPLVQAHVHHFRSVEHLVPSSATTSPTPTLPLPLPRRPHYALDNNDHISTASSSAAVETHFRSVVEGIVVNVLPVASQTAIIKTLVREVLLGTILLPLFEMLCDGDFWNRQIDEQAGKYLLERKQVDRFLSALSALPDPSKGPKRTPRKSRVVSNPPGLPATSMSSASSTKQFEVFLRSISKVKTIGEARRLRSDIERESRIAKLALDEAFTHNAGGKKGEIQLKRAKTYAKRLDRARLEVEYRINALAQHQVQNGTINLAQSGTLPKIHYQAENDASIDLMAILCDPSSLAYWLEFMERRGKSRQVQFWLTVDGFKNPLEDMSATGSLSASFGREMSRNMDTAYEDLVFLHGSYCAGPNGLSLPSHHEKKLAQLVQSERASVTLEALFEARQAMIWCQEAVFDDMQAEDWPEFLKSELYRKTSAELSRSPNLTSRSRLSSAEASRSPEIATRSVSPNLNSSTTSIPSPTAQSSRLKPLPVKRQGSFEPAGSVSPSTIVTTQLPSFERTITEPRPSIARKLSEEVPTLSSGSSLPVTPGSDSRRPSQLDFLFKTETADGMDEKPRLFDDEREEDEEILLDEDDEDFVQVQRMEAIQAALNDIIASDDLASGRRSVSVEKSPEPEPSPMSASLVLPRPRQEAERERRLSSRSVEDLSILKASRGATSSRRPLHAPISALQEPQTGSYNGNPSKPDTVAGRTLFEDDALEDRLTDAIDDDQVNDVSVDDASLSQVTSPTGNLHLAEDIVLLQGKIQELDKQESLLQSLIRQAELTGNQRELRILQKSLSSVLRELRSAVFQKTQMEQQEVENRLVPGRTHVTIPSTFVTSDGHEKVVRYVILVEQYDQEGNRKSEWSLPRRYNEFWDLDRALRDRYSASNDFGKIAELPPKRLVTNLSSTFIESRRIGLERYLQTLLSSQLLCESTILRSFLSRSTISFAPSGDRVNTLAPPKFVKTLYRTMTTATDDAVLGPNMLDLMYTSLNRQWTELGGLVGMKLSSEELANMGGTFVPQMLRSYPTKEASAKIAPQVSGLTQSQSLETGAGSFTAPICDLFIEVFDLKESNWLRRQAIVVIIQQFLGATIERKCRDVFASATSPPSIERLLDGFQDALWPGGERRQPTPPRTDDEKLETKINASRKLGMLLPDIAASMIGRGNARRAARRVFGSLQDRRLNQNLMLCIIDEVVAAIFGIDAIRQGK